MHLEGHLVDAIHPKRKLTIAGNDRVVLIAIAPMHGSRSEKVDYYPGRLFSHLWVLENHNAISRVVHNARRGLSLC